MFQVNKSSSDFWNSLNLTWQQWTDLPEKCWTTSVAELDGKVYATVSHSKGGYVNPLVYECKKDQWSWLPSLPYAHFSLVTVPDRKQLLAIGGSVNNNGVIEVTNKVFLWNEENRKWTTPYPNMPTARCRCSSISYGSTVVVAGGITCRVPLILTKAVEVLHIKEHSLFTKSHWKEVEQLPYVMFEAVPLIVEDKVYFIAGYSDEVASTCSVVTTSLPELLQSVNKNTIVSQVWNKLPDMPYSSFSINHYQGHLITFSGGYQVERSDKDKPVSQSVPLIHIYSPDTRTWDYLGEIPYGYLLGRSIHIRKNKLIFIGGVTGTHDLTKDDDMIISCSILTLSPW